MIIKQHHSHIHFSYSIKALKESMQFSPNLQYIRIFHCKSLYCLNAPVEATVSDRAQEYHPNINFFARHLLKTFFFLHQHTLLNHCPPPSHLLPGPFHFTQKTLKQNKQIQRIDMNRIGRSGQTCLDRVDRAGSTWSMC